MKLINLGHVVNAINETCTCGGGGPGECCLACEVYHHLVSNLKAIEVDHKTAHEWESRANQRKDGE